MTNDDDHVERATTFSANEAPSGKRLDGTEEYSDYYDRLSRLNSLRWNGEWSDTGRENAIDRSAMLDSIASQLQLTDYQHDEASREHRSLPRRIHEGYPRALVAICVCGIVGRRDGRNYHPNNIRGESNSPLSGIVENLDYSYTQVYNCWEAVREVIE